MKCFVDGDQVCVVRDDFVDLQESPAVFIPLESQLGFELANFGLEGASQESVLTFLVERRLCLTPIMKSMWTAFPVGGWDTFGVKNASHSLVRAVLFGALASDEVVKQRSTGLKCLECKAAVIRDILKETMACDCLERPLYVQAEDEPISEAVPEHVMTPKQWVCADLVVDEELSDSV